MCGNAAGWARCCGVRCGERSASGVSVARAAVSLRPVDRPHTTQPTRRRERRARIASGYRYRSRRRITMNLNFLLLAKHTLHTQAKQANQHHDIHTLRTDAQTGEKHPTHTRQGP